MPHPTHQQSPPRPRIRADCFLLCDHVRLDNGKLDILGGGWDSITPPRLPLAYRIDIAIKLTVPVEIAEPSLRLRLELIDQQEREAGLDPLEIDVRLDEGEVGSTARELPVMVPLGIDVTLMMPGTYTVRLSSGADAIAESSFRVAEPLISGETDPEGRTSPPATLPEDKRDRGPRHRPASAPH